MVCLASVTDFSRYGCWYGVPPAAKLAQECSPYSRALIRYARNNACWSTVSQIHMGVPLVLSKTLTDRELVESFTFVRRKFYSWKNEPQLPTSRSVRLTTASQVLHLTVASSLTPRWPSGT